MTRARGAFPWLVVGGLLLVALSLRAPIVAPTPILADIQRDLGVTSATVGLLATAPVLMFAVLTPVAALVIRRAGAEAAVLLALLVVLLGTVLRTLPGFAGLLTGTVVIGVGITVGNVVVPVIIRRDVPPPHVSTVTAAYVAVMNAGSLVTVLIMVPLAEAIGWTPALLAWALVTLAGIALWTLHMRRDRPSTGRWAEADSGEPATSAAPADDARAASARTPDLSQTGPVPVAGVARGAAGARHPVTWLLMAAFACQTAAYYSLTTWLPSIARDELGLDAAQAAVLASLFQGIAVAGAFLVPLLGRLAAPLVPVLVICACWLVTGIGSLVAPEALPVWIATGAVAHAGGFVVIFTILVRVARSDRQAAGMSALVQGVGYAIAAVAPPLVGALHESTGGWVVPLAAIAVATTSYSVFVLTAERAARRD